MSGLAQRVEPIRSAKLRNAARGEECTLQIFGVCVGGTETTVLAHLHDSSSFGMGQKADDTSGVFACHGCHDEIDGRTRKTDGADLTWYKLRALQRTIRRLVEKGVLFLQRDMVTPVNDRPVKPRKPPEERAKVAPGRPLQSRSNWPKGRKISPRTAHSNPQD